LAIGVDGFTIDDINERTGIKNATIDFKLAVYCKQRGESAGKSEIIIHICNKIGI
jgi:hypothetical protein